ncbi:uncharacterized protein TNCV_673431 [Trichonephila clavipes]|uniref:Uncharacterized protein n=1 Tax=Trichonephila clavipes TaxID=2585209 RepID=A0A8X6WCP4_TRICX|nr:uncharacterized protein TNCV_673431 [Trichonephila clavipes]
MSEELFSKPHPVAAVAKWYRWPQKPSGQDIGSWLTCHEFEPNTTKDTPCSGAMYVKSVESSKILPFVRCGSEERGCQLRCPPRHLTMVQNFEVNLQKPSCG